MWPVAHVATTAGSPLAAGRDGAGAAVAWRRFMAGPLQASNAAGSDVRCPRTPTRDERDDISFVSFYRVDFCGMGRTEAVAFFGWCGLRNHLRAETSHQVPEKRRTTPTAIGA